MLNITITYSVQFNAIFNDVKNVNFQMKNSDIFLIFARGVDCGCAVLASFRGLCFGAEIRK